jgi:hypothetical protein
MRIFFGRPLWVISGQTLPGQNPEMSAIVRKRTLNTAQMEQAGLDQLHRSPQRILGFIAANVLMPHELLDCSHFNTPWRLVVC